MPDRPPVPTIQLPDQSGHTTRIVQPRPVRLPRLHPVDAYTGTYEAAPKPGRNDPCPGGCGRKVKRCGCAGGAA